MIGSPSMCLKVVWSTASLPPLHTPECSRLVSCAAVSGGVVESGGVWWRWLIIVSSYFVRDTRKVLFFSCHRGLCLSTKATLFEFGKQCFGL